MKQGLRGIFDLPGNGVISEKEQGLLSEKWPAIVI
jgi:hypothetical protein